MNRQRLIVILIVLVFGGAGLWFFYFQSSPAEEAPADGLAAPEAFSSSSPDVQRIEQELADLRRLKDLQIDTSILQNPFLQSLESPRTPVPTPPSGTGTTTPAPGTRGRQNPFLPF